MWIKFLQWIFILMIVNEIMAADSDYNILNTDGSYDFRYDNPDSYHESHASRNNIVNGVFAGRNPGTGNLDRTEYTAGPRGFRPKGKNIVRKYDLSQRAVGPIGNKDDPYFDPYEDPSYNFQFNTREYARREGANRFGDVKGSYTYLDDVGDKHEVEYIAGKNTGFHVKTPHPDSYPNAYRSLFFRDPRKPYMRGRSFVQRGIDGSYRFAAVGPDQRRTEVSDSVGNVRGSYTYKDEKGVLHSVHYIAGPNIGYRVLKNVKGPHLPTIFPFNSPDILPPNYYDGKETDSDVFAQAASTYVTPKPSKDDEKYGSDNLNQIDKSTQRPSFDSTSFRPTKAPPGGFEDEAGDDDDTLFDSFFSGGGKQPSNRPSMIKPSTYRPPIILTRPTVKPSLAGVTSRPPNLANKPQNAKPGSSEAGLDYDDDNDLFGTKPSAAGGAVFDTKPSLTSGGAFGTKPSSGTKPPPSGSGVFDSRPPSSNGGVFGTKPTPSDDDDIFGMKLPTSNDDLFDIGPSGIGSPSGAFRPTGSGVHGTRPTFPTGTFRPRPPKPTVTEQPVLQFDLTGPGDGDRYHTIITNYGDTVFTAPPGVPVRAHVQSIGLVPLYPRSPSPSEQYNAELHSGLNEEDVETAANSHVNVTSTSSTTTSTIPATLSVISSTTKRAETTTFGGTTTPLPETTTTS